MQPAFEFRSVLDVDKEGQGQQWIRSDPPRNVCEAAIQFMYLHVHVEHHIQYHVALVRTYK